MSTIAIDFDGVLSNYTGWKGHEAPFDPPVDGAIKAIRDYQDAGLTVCVFTARADSAKSTSRIQQWLLDNGLEYRRAQQVTITSTKPPAVVYLDDRAWQFMGFFPTPEEIKNYKTWQGY
jgi:hypothetical protein